MKLSDTSLQRYIFPNINEDGWKFISLLVIITILSLLLYLPFGCVFLVLTIWCFYNFRDVTRITPVLSSAVIAPVDGYVVSISREKGPDVFGLERKNFTRVCIYSSLFDAHISRMPIKSTVRQIFYDGGKFCSATFDKNNISNERLLIALKANGNNDFVIQQTANFFGKRLCANIKKGDMFLAGQRFGFTRFSAYTDLYLPEKTEPQICVGQYLVGGETIIADINSDAPRIEGETR